VLGSVLTFYVLFAVVRAQPSRLYDSWQFRDTRVRRLETMDLARSGGLKVTTPEVYETAVNVVRQHATNGLMIAAPDSPELYFLTGLRNPTAKDGGLESEDLLRAIQTDGLNVVAVNEVHTFGGQMTPAMRNAISTRFPHSTAVENYTIYWKH
jgi:hypothetical protein